MGASSARPLTANDHVTNADEKKVYDSQDNYVQALIEDATGSTAEAANKSDSDGEEANDAEHQQSPRVLSAAEDELDIQSRNVDISQYEFPFENLVFEGGGNKGLAYVGSIQVLEEIGAYKNIKRFAGASAGAMTAALLAVGYNSQDIKEFLSQDLSRIFIDHSWGYLSLLPNLISGYGWNPGTRIFEWFGQTLQRQTGNADITFKQVYEKYQKELCIVSTNLNMMTAEYFHMKTTPDVPVRVALRMSMAIPGLFQASRHVFNGVENVYVDGGVLCNYPINCFDGWWLSMENNDSFLNRLQPLENLPCLYEKKERFGTFNHATLGFLLFADSEKDILKVRLEQRAGTDCGTIPDTALAREKAKKKKTQETVKRKHVHMCRAVNAFLKVLKKHNKNNDNKINKTELANALKDTEDFPPRYVERLFGKLVTVDEAMDALDKDGNGDIYFNEVLRLVERTGVSLITRFLDYERTEINGLFSFFNALQNALQANVKRLLVEERDFERTIGINTGHVGTTDFSLEPADREYVVKQGRRATEAFLRYYVVKNNVPLKGQSVRVEDTTTQSSDKQSPDEKQSSDDI